MLMTDTEGKLIGDINFYNEEETKKFIEGQHYEVGAKWHNGSFMACLIVPIPKTE